MRLFPSCFKDEKQDGDDEFVWGQRRVNPFMIGVKRQIGQRCFACVRGSVSTAAFECTEQENTIKPPLPAAFQDGSSRLQPDSRSGHVCLVLPWRINPLHMHVCYFS